MAQDIGSNSDSFQYCQLKASSSRVANTVFASRWGRVMSIVKDKILVEADVELDADTPAPTLVRRFDDLGVDGVVLDGVMSAAECKRCMEAAEAAKFTFWDPSGVTEEAKRQRTADTVEYMGNRLCAALWPRLRPFVPARCTIDAEAEDMDRALDGEWAAHSLNPH